MARLTPIDYQMQVMNPMAAALEGYQAGFGQMQQLDEVRRQREADDLQRRATELEMSEAQQRMDIVTAEQNRIAEGRGLVSAIYEDLNNNEYVSQDRIKNVIARFPTIAGPLQQQLERQTEEENTRSFNAYSQAAFIATEAIETGDTSMLENFLDERIAATEDNPDMQRMFQGHRQALDVFGPAYIAVQARLGAAKFGNAEQNAVMDEYFSPKSKLDLRSLEAQADIFEAQAEFAEQKSAAEAQLTETNAAIAEITARNLPVSQQLENQLMNAQIGLTYAQTGQIELNALEAANAAPELREDEARAASHMESMSQNISDIANALIENPRAARPGGGEAFANMIGAGEAYRGMHNLSERQRVVNAYTAILGSAIWLSTGAGVTSQQYKDQLLTIMPRYNDSPETVRDKQERTIRLITDSQARAGEGWTPEMEQTVEELKTLFEYINLDPNDREAMLDDMASIYNVESE